MIIGNMSLKKFAEQRNNILFISDWGGLGDVIIHRMLFHDVKKIIQDAKIHFCCLPQYADVVADHPYIDRILNPSEVKKEDYIVFYQTDVKIANKYETNKGSECTRNRAEVWSLYCGFEIEDHELHFNLNDKIKEQYKEKIEKFRIKKDQPIIIFSPKSAISTKSLLPKHIEKIAKYLEDFNVIVLEKNQNDEMKNLGIQTICNTTLFDWIYYTSVSDYVISVDTSTFHLAGGLKKPLLGIFTFANGKTYGKYYDFVLVQKHKDNGDWDCGPCYNFKLCPKTNKELKPCLTELSFNSIETGIREMFNKWPWNNKISLGVID
jgi:ADP-heptose:LPS heptosyltransferase